MSYAITQEYNWPLALNMAKEELASLKVLKMFKKNKEATEYLLREMQLQQALALYENGKRSPDLYMLLIGGL